MSDNIFTKKMPVGYGMVQTKVMKLNGLSIQAKSLYALLCSYTGGNDYCFPSVLTLGKDLNLSKTSIIKYLNELEKIKLIERNKLYNDYRRHNKYEILFIE